MKKIFLAFSIILLLGMLFIGTGCGEKGASVSQGGVDMYSLIPADASGIFSINFKKIAGLEIYDKLIEEVQKESKKKEGEIFENYQDFITKTGIDPKKDIHFMVAAPFGELEGKDVDFAVVLNLNYDKVKILGLLKESKKEFTEEQYKDITLFKSLDDNKKEICFSFLNKNMIAAGNPAKVKQIVDLSKGEGKSILDSETMKPYLEQFKPDSIISFAFGLPEKVRTKQQTGSPFKMDLSKAEAVWGYVKYDSETWAGEMKLVSPNGEGNKELVNNLNMFKGMGAMAGPEVAELLNNITLTSSADDITLKFSITNELLEKLQQKAKEKAQSKTGFEN
jgi:hypothetical protein